MTAKCEKQVLTLRDMGSQKMHEFFGEKAEKKRCFQPLDFPRRQRLPRSSCGKAIASLRGMSEAAILNTKHKESAASDMKLATPWRRKRDLNFKLYEKSDTIKENQVPLKPLL